MQQTEQTCPFTAAAYALQPAIDRARYLASHAVDVARLIDPENTGTVSAAAELYRTSLEQQKHLDWLQGLCICAAQNSNIAETLISEINSQGTGEAAARA